MVAQSTRTNALESQALPWVKTTFWRLSCRDAVKVDRSRNPSEVWGACSAPLTLTRIHPSGVPSRLPRLVARGASQPGRFHQDCQIIAPCAHRFGHRSSGAGGAHFARRHEPARGPLLFGGSWKPGVRVRGESILNLDFLQPALPVAFDASSRTFLSCTDADSLRFALERILELGLCLLPDSPTLAPSQSDPAG